jgi:hypothetical protein
MEGSEWPGSTHAPRPAYHADRSAVAPIDEQLGRARDRAAFNRRIRSFVDGRLARLDQTSSLDVRSFRQIRNLSLAFATLPNVVPNLSERL